MTLEELSAAWQSLRNAMFGRSGMDRKVSPELAERFEVAYAAWRKWYEEAGPLDEAKGSLGGAEQHIDALRRLTAAAAKEGVKPDRQLPETPTEALGSALRAVGTIIGLGLGATAAVLLIGRRDR